VSRDAADVKGPTEGVTGKQDHVIVPYEGREAKVSRLLL